MYIYVCVYVRMYVFYFIFPKAHPGALGFVVLSLEFFAQANKTGGGEKIDLFC